MLSHEAVDAYCFALFSPWHFLSVFRAFLSFQMGSSPEVIRISTIGTHKLISEHGHLPARDMHRWLPLGRDLEQTLPLYSYALAYIHKTVAWIFPNISLYQITLYAPTICFVVGLGVLFIFLWRAFGILFAALAGVLLTILPSTIDRSVAGFSDRDSWCPHARYPRCDNISYCLAVTTSTYEVFMDTCQWFYHVSWWDELGRFRCV